MSAVSEIEGAIDVAFISVPADAVESTLRDCAAAGVGFAVVLTAGFEGPGADARRTSLDHCVNEVRQQGMRVLGPNCIGLVSVASQMFLRPAMYARALPAPGGIAVLSQSGGLSLTVINEAAAWGIPLQSVVHTGNESDLGLEDFLEYYATHDDCHAIALSIEQVRRPAEFAAAARLAATNGKRLVYLKTGRSVRGGEAAATHTGAVAGDARVYDAFLAELGFIRARTPRELLLTADTLWPTPRDNDRQVGVVSISGGEAALSADLAEEHGVSLVRPRGFPRLSRDLGEDLGNPVDVTGQVYGNPHLIENAIRDLKDDESCGPIVLSFPPMATAHFEEFTAPVGRINAETAGSVAVICNVTSEDAFAAAARLRERNVAVFESLDEAFAKLRAVGTPAAVGSTAPEEQDGAVSDDVQLRSGTHLSALAPRIRSLRLPLPAIAVVDADGRVPAEIKYPIALKVEHPHVVHRAKAGLLYLNVTGVDEAAQLTRELLATAEALGLDGAVVAAQEMARLDSPAELLVGYRRDSGLGSVLILGSGGAQAGAEGRQGADHAYIQVGAPEMGRAVRAVEEAIARHWIPVLEPVQGEQLAERILAIWTIALEEGFVDWEVNPLLVDQSGDAAIVDGIGFR